MLKFDNTYLKLFKKVVNHEWEEASGSWLSASTMYLAALTVSMSLEFLLSFKCSIISLQLSINGYSNPFDMKM